MITFYAWWSKFYFSSYKLCFSLLIVHCALVLNVQKTNIKTVKNDFIIEDYVLHM
jgi:hypothetical protein